jgi:hypothetical protein
MNVGDYPAGQGEDPDHMAPNEAEEPNVGLFAVVRSLLGHPRQSQILPRDRPEKSEPPVELIEPPAEPAIAAAPAEPEVSHPSAKSSSDERQTRTPAELAAIILNALRTLDDCPERGFAVTVYGSNPWNAMLMIKPEAGRVADPALWRERVGAMAVRLRQDYDTSGQ